MSPVEKTQVLKVSYLSEDPQFAAQAVNTLAAEYVDYSFDSKREATDKAREFLEKELARLETEDRAIRGGAGEVCPRPRHAGASDEKNNVVLQKARGSQSRDDQGGDAGPLESVRGRQGRPADENFQRA